VTTARLLTELDDRRLPDGRRELQQDLIVDLGVYLRELHEWAVDRQLEDRVYFSDRFVDGQAYHSTVLRIPAGYITNYASIPSWAPAWLVGRWDQTDCASVVHDGLYEWGAPRGPSDTAWWIIARSGERHLNAFQGAADWAGLRLGGWRVHRRYVVAGGPK
jgi:hypothetical protein